jgi:hypothetical protein
MAEQISLTIEGEPGQEVQVWYRGDRESEEPAPIVYTGKLDEKGSLTITVPRAYLLVGSPTRRGGIPLQLGGEDGPSKTVRLTSTQS